MADIQINPPWHYLVGSGRTFRGYYRLGTRQPPPHAHRNETASCNRAGGSWGKNVADSLSLARRMESRLRAAAVVICGVRPQEAHQGGDDASVDGARLASGVAAGIAEAGHSREYGAAAKDGHEPLRVGGVAERGCGIVPDDVGGVVAEGCF